MKKSMSIGIILLIAIIMLIIYRFYDETRERKPDVDLKHLNKQTSVKGKNDCFSDVQSSMNS